MSGLGGFNPALAANGVMPLPISPTDAQVNQEILETAQELVDGVSAGSPGQATASIDLLGAPLITPLQRPAIDPRQPQIDRLMAVARSKNLPPAHMALIQQMIDRGTSAQRLEMISEALTHLGKPYRWGATGPSSFDCSGFSRQVYRAAANIELPRVSRNQARAGESVTREQLQPGDLVFFGSRTRISHVGIYLGTDERGRPMMINAAGGGPRGNGPNARVRIDPLRQDYRGAQRFINDEQMVLTPSPDTFRNASEYFMRGIDWLSAHFGLAS